jgi:hypothetical protein
MVDHQPFARSGSGMSDDSAGQLATENARLRRQLTERDAQLTQPTEGATQTGTSRAGARITVHALYLFAMIAYFLQAGLIIFGNAERWTLLKLGGVLMGMTGVSAFFAAWRRRRG